MSGPVSRTVRVDGVERTISGDPEHQTLRLWDGTDITHLSGEQVRDLILLRNMLERLDVLKAKLPPFKPERTMAQRLSAMIAKGRGRG